MLNGVVELHAWLCFPDVIVQRIRNIWAPVQLLDINHASTIPGAKGPRAQIEEDHKIGDALCV